MSTKYDSAMVIVIVLIFIRTLLRYSNLYGIDSSTSLVASAFVFFALVSQYIEYLFLAPNLGEDDGPEVEEELRGQGQAGRGDKDRVPDGEHQHHRHTSVT